MQASVEANKVKAASEDSLEPTDIEELKSIIAPHELPDEVLENLLEWRAGFVFPTITRSVRSPVSVPNPFA